MTLEIAQDSILPSLRRRWLITALLAGLLLLAGYHVLALAWQTGRAFQWLLQASLGMIYLLWVLGRNLSANHRLGEARLLPDFGAGNVVTLFRGMLIACLIGFLLQPRPDGWVAWLPGALYTLAVLADFLDGYLARLTRRATRLGEILDMSLDGWGVLVASLLAIQYEQVPLWYLAVALARYLFMIGIWLRRRLNLPVYELSPSVRRRAFAGVQMGFLFFILMPVFAPPGTHLAAAIFALPFLVGFMLDWLTVSGVFKTQPGESSTFSQVLSKIKVVALEWLPVAIRLLVVVLLFWELARLLPPTLNPMMEGGVWAQVVETDLFILSIVSQALVLIALSLGIGGRIAAIIGLCSIGVQQMFASLTPTQIVLVILYTSILYLGTGLLSLWKPEERLIMHHAGE